MTEEHYEVALTAQVVPRDGEGAPGPSDIVSFFTTTDGRDCLLSSDRIAALAHEVNRAYCESIGDDSQVPWADAPKWQKDSATNGVMFMVNNPDATPEDSHNAWLEEKYHQGWKFGPEKDEEKKEHPCFRPYDALPLEQRVKDALFQGVVRACLKL